MINNKKTLEQWHKDKDLNFSEKKTLNELGIEIILPSILYEI